MMPAARRARWGEILLTLPSLCWLALFFAVPTAIVFAIALRPSDPFGGVGRGFTLATLAQLLHPAYPAMLWRTFWLSAATTLICLALATPTGCYVARAPRRWRTTLLLLVIVPFWTSFLIRVFAWKVLLHPEGHLKRLLAGAGLVAPEASLLYRPGAVLLVMVYTFLPFAILPVYATAEKFDPRLLEAARDLGATRWQAFTRVFLPGIRRGLVTATLVVFIPALGTYVIPDLVGGPSSEMIGNKIAQRVFTDRNLPHAAALSALLTLAVLLPLGGIFLAQRRRPAGPSSRAVRR